MTGDTKLPTGTVTFLFTDVERSTETVAAMGNERYADALAAHRQLLREAFNAHDGHEVGTEGDAFFVAFARAQDAVLAAIDSQRALESHAWSGEARLRVRMGLHTGEVLVRDNDYVGHDVHRAKRISEAGHGGQILLSEITAGLISGRLQDGATIFDLGSHRLKDLTDGQRIFQVVAEGLLHDFPPLRSLESFRHNLPLRRTSFVGREDEIRLVRKHLDNSRLVTLTGVGGCGKTRLALQVAVEEIDAFSDGVIFVDLAPVPHEELLPATVSRAMGASHQGGLTRDQLVAELAHKRMLLVLDNCEHLVEACSDLADEVLDQCPGVKMLATSREALEVEGEQTHTVASLGLATAAGYFLSDAVRLFRDRAFSVRDDFSLTVTHHDEIAEICRRLDGLPLAIELAAAQIAHLSPRQIADRLDQRLSLLSGGRRKLQRQRTLQAVIDWSHDLLTEDERATFRRLAVFSGGFSLDAAEQILATDGDSPVVEVIASLVKKSLVVTDERPDMHYRLLETLRLYAEDKLVAAGEADDFRTRHRDYFVAWCESQPDDDALRIDASVFGELNNLRTAMEWSKVSGRYDLVARVASTMLAQWDLVDPEEGWKWLSASQQAVDDLPSEEAVRVLVATAWVMMLVDPNASPWATLHRAVELAGDRPGFWSSHAHAFVAGEHFAAALRGEDVADMMESSCLRALELATSPGARFAAFRQLGLTRFATDLPGAVDALEEAERVGRQIGANVSFVAFNLTVAYHLTGADDAAQRAAERARSDNTRFLETILSLPLAVTTAVAGRHGNALDLIRELLGAAAPLNRTRRIYTVSVLGVLAALRGHWRSAAILLGSAGAAMEGFMSASVALLVLYRHYVLRTRDALGDERRELRQKGAAMSLDEAIAFGLAARIDQQKQTRPLTVRELEVVTLLAEGLTSKQIAQRLVVADRTVDAHVEHIRNKLGLRTRAQIVAWVAAEGSGS